MKRATARHSLLASLLIGLSLAAAALVGATSGDRVAGSTGAALPEDTAAVVHLLGRATFGPRPGDVERVKAAGIRAWIELQLAPERIDDSALEARLAGFETIGLSARELAERYYVPALRERQTQTRDVPHGAGPAPPPVDSANVSRSDAPPLDTRRPRRITEAQQIQREAASELVHQKLLRAALSERQLQEVLVDFWFNHFNVSASKGPTRLFVLEYERDVIRPHVLGRFRDLLGATAKSPAMLFFLDNWMNSDPNASSLRAAPGRPMRGRGVRVVAGSNGATVPAQVGRARGINENYARELMELHTLGVDGGYTQHDVNEVARVFTGWTIDDPRRGGGFVFRPMLHDAGSKTVMGIRLPAGGGQRDGEQVLDLLSRHPSTARLISTKLARRFVSDDPSRALIDRMAETFRTTDGDLRAVTRTLLLSAEFFAEDVRHAKVKTPLEFVVSAVRVTDARAIRPQVLVRGLRELGMPLYLAQAPTGYSEDNDAWVTAGALMARMNFAVALTGRASAHMERRADRPRGPAGRPAAAGSDAFAAEAVGGDAVDQVIDQTLHGDVSPSTRAVIARATSREQMMALALGSPEFQRR